MNIVQNSYGKSVSIKWGEGSRLDNRSEKLLPLIRKRKLHNSKFPVRYSAVQKSHY
jgi:hypothetical protein